MIRDIEELLGQYRAWLQHKTSLKDVGGWVEITTPFLDRHNDCIQIYARREDGIWTLTDDGYTISDLESSGCEINTSDKRRAIVNNTLRGFGVTMGDHDSLVVRASDAEFAYKKHNLIQAILGVGDIFYLTRAKVVSIFFEDVRKWMDAQHIRYSQSVRFAGKSGFDHQFDFVIPHSDRRPERLVKLLNIPNKNTAESTIFSCVDVLDNRPTPTRAYAIVNDQREVPPGVVEALSAYNIKPVLWSHKEAAVEELAA
jgi:hypothetical protein